MGAAAAAADVAVLTSDNPRSEEPRAILDAVEAGARRAVAQGAPAEVLVEEDRRIAIARALALARPGDVVLIAGKGHETGQEFADRTVPFDDRLVARELLSTAASSPGGAHP
jgi:UDP-N-acetylmuramoyl-L-alanyl-D-glutamate--2,6-diaminopimelate ligase